jgi:hypothetical protein
MLEKEEEKEEGHPGECLNKSAGHEILREE